ncbi:hypothetical protein RUND412_003399 [Rhizina undulata]
MLTVLLTGANGYIAGSILKYLIEPQKNCETNSHLRGNYTVVGTVLTKAKGDELLANDPSLSEKLTLAFVPDMSVPGCWDAVIKAYDFDYVIHTASPCTGEFIEPALQGTKEILRAVKEYGKNVKRVVYTASFAAVVDLSKGELPGKIYTYEDWAPEIPREVITEDVWHLAYLASKRYAEKAAWDFVKDENPSFDLVSIVPPMVLGPPGQSITSLTTGSQTIRYFYEIMNATLSTPHPMMLWLWSDMRDIALTHVRALEKPAAGNKRFLISAGHYCWQKVCDILREKFPELVNRVPKGDPGKWFPETGLSDADSEPSRSILGIVYRELEETVVDTTRDILKAEERLGIKVIGWV